MKSAHPSRRQQPAIADRPTWLLVAIAGVVALVVGAARMKDHILYNGSSSMPIGFYLRTDKPIVRDAIVTVRASDVAPAYARLRGFTGERDRFIKHVVGVAGDEVCASGDTVSLNGAILAHRQTRDSVGRMLPAWLGCETLASDEVFLIGETEDSFDGRYFGPIQRANIEGVWRPLLVSQQQQH